MSCDFFEALQKRRSRYALGASAALSEDKIVDLLAYCLKQAPSAFNSQSARIVVLFGANHQKLWGIALDSLKAIVPAANFAPTKEKIDSFAAAYGTVLYFEDTKTVEGLQQQFPAYKEKFPTWAQQANGMLQYMVWTGLGAQGIGASLQHYNPIIDSDVSKAFDIPPNWGLLAQMPFGQATAPDAPKDFTPIEQRLKVFK